MQVRDELNFIIKILKEAYANYGNRFENVNHKDSYDLVTDLDFSIENYLTKQIKAHFPNDNIIGEECNLNPMVEGRNWTVDPIDGTVNLANNIPIYGTQCSMIADGSPQIGVIYFPEYDIMCYAEKGKGAYGQHGKLSCALNYSMKDAIITLGDFSHNSSIRYNNQIQVLQKLAPEVAKVRMFGAASYDFFMLATGSTSAHIMFSKKVWDIMPGLLISQEAGAVITNLQGDAYSLEDDNILAAANQSISEQILGLLNKC